MVNLRLYNIPDLLLLKIPTSHRLRSQLQISAAILSMTHTKNILAASLLIHPYLWNVNAAQQIELCTAHTSEITTSL